MAIRWEHFTQPDGRGDRQILISDKADWDLFNCVAQTLEVGLDGTWTQKVDGEDERYWDFDIAEGKVTLHLQHYLGITVYPTDGADAGPPSLLALEKVYRLLASQLNGRLPVPERLS